ncbi:MAG: hypothetical protein EBU90_24160 [Proteobacteria bacterium]|nr:hypothetical protein [Pseudomonadota bacterium]
MSVLNRNPQNTNILQPTKFLLTFNRIGAVQYFCQSVNLPGFSLQEITRSTPFIDTYSPGTKLTYNALEVSFIIDEALVGWKNLHDWFTSIASPEGFEKRYDTSLDKTNKNLSDANLTILSALNNPVARIQFINAFPTTITDINFDTTLSADTIITARATFRYDYYKVITV